MLFSKLLRKQRKQQTTQPTPATTLFTSEDLWITNDVSKFDDNENFFSFIIGSVYAHKCGDWGKANAVEMDNKLKGNLQVESVFDLPEEFDGLVPFRQIRVVTDSARMMTSVWTVEPTSRVFMPGVGAVA